MTHQLYIIVSTLLSSFASTNAVATYSAREREYQACIGVPSMHGSVVCCIDQGTWRTFGVAVSHLRLQVKQLGWYQRKQLGDRRCLQIVFNPAAAAASADASTVPEWKPLQRDDRTVHSRAHEPHWCS